MFNYLKAIFRSMVIGCIGVFLVYLFGACLSSFVEQQNNFNTTEWSEVGRALFFLFSTCIVLVAIANAWDEINYIYKYREMRDV
ncbi:TMhelix containing protein [Vibrio phage 1.201.B._10N.286.55.F1]|nr:TMhelix containing protein [Vibrio phage 1.201.B._10N.286.55.F1]